MTNTKGNLINFINNYRLKGISKPYATALREALISLLNTQSVEKFDDILDAYFLVIEDILNSESFDDLNDFTELLKLFESIKPYLGPDSQDLFKTTTILELKKYRETEPLFVAVLDVFQDIMKMDDDKTQDALISVIDFFFEDLLMKIENDHD